MDWCVIGLVGRVCAANSNVEWTFYGKSGAFGDVGINHSGFGFGVSEEFLNMSQVNAVFEHVGGVAMAQHVWRDYLF